MIKSGFRPQVIKGDLDLTIPLTGWVMLAYIE